MLSRRISKTRLAAIAVLASSVAMVNVTAAQQPSPEQGEAIRKNCIADFMSYCASVQPGGREALQCLQQHAAQLSSACSGAVSAMSAAVAPNSTPTQQPPALQQPPLQQADQDALKAVRQACTLEDFTSHCLWIDPTTPELLQCLRHNASQLSPSCQTTVLADTRTVPVPSLPVDGAAASAPAASVASAPPVPAAAPAAASSGPGSNQIGAIRAACASDFMSHCARVQPGSRDALLCLQRNKAAVTPACQAALAALANSVEANPGSATPFASPAPAAPKSLPPPPGPAQALAILRACAPEALNLCGNIPPGNKRVLACLAQNASRLGPQCQAALAKAGG